MNLLNRVVSDELEKLTSPDQEVLQYGATDRCMDWLSVLSKKVTLHVLAQDHKSFQKLFSNLINRHANCLLTLSEKVGNAFAHTKNLAGPYDIIIVDLPEYDDMMTCIYAAKKGLKPEGKLIVFGFETDPDLTFWKTDFFVTAEIDNTVWIGSRCT